MLINLHQHSHFSVLDAVAKIKPLVKRATELDMTALAITDHGTMAGAFEFYLECNRADIKPIIGVEMYLDDSNGRKGTYRHIILLAKNYRGYKNLLHIVSEAHVKGFYYRPRTTTDIVFKYGDGLVASTACMGGLLGKIKSDKEAIKEAKRWRERFGDDFYIELQFNEISAQKYHNARMDRIAKKTGIKMITTLDSHYVDAKDTALQDFVLLVRNKKNIDDRLKAVYDARSLYLMDHKELFSRMRKWGYNVPKIEFKRMLANARDIAERCDLKIPTGEFHLPDMGMEIDGFRKLVKRKFKEFSFADKATYRARIKEELRIISKLGFHDYFLIVQDLIRWCRKNDIFVGPARGSVAGSLIAYVLKITKIDPIRHGLIFERFLNESRVDMPDIDMDFDSNKRDRVIEYLNTKYGNNKVARVISYGTFGQVGALRDAGRVFKLPQRPINEIASAVHRTGSIKDAYNDLSGILKDFWKENLKYIKMAQKVTTLNRNVGVHPCGVVIAPKPIYKYCPLQRVKGQVVSAYSEGVKGRELTEIGLIKLDILGLNTCSIISDTLTLIRETTGKNMLKKIWDLNLRDKRLIKEAAKGNTTGGFQFETDSATRLIKQVKPKTFYEIAALCAINRPGPLASGAVERFVNYEGLDIENEDIERILKETRGTLVYQEQVMQLLHKVAGYTLVQADNIRKMAAKKIFKKKERIKFEKEFLRRCAREIGRDDAETLWKVIGEFTKYSFNKSHAVSYAYLFFQVLYLKVYYPRQFFVGLLSNTATGLIKDKKYGSEKNKIYRYINEARRYGLSINGPDINKSGMSFSIEGNGIRFGLNKIKGIKDSSAEEIVSKRPYKSFGDFIKRISGKVHKGKIVALIQAGCFDCFGDRDSIKREFNSIRKDKVFDLSKTFLEDPVDAFGFILLHPFFFDKVKTNLQKRYVVTSQQLAKFERWEKVRVAGVIINVEIKMAGKSAMVIKLEDHRGDMFVYLDKEAAKRFKSILKPFNLIMVDGRLMGANRILCYAAKDKIYNITDKIATLLEDPSCRKKRLI